VNHQDLSSFIWSVADLLRGDYKQSDYGKVILPFTVLRRLDCVLEPTKAKVLAEFAAKKKAGLNPDPFLLRASGQSFYNTSDMDLRKLMGDQDHISQNLYAYVQGFSPAVRDIFERFSFSTQIDKLSKSGLLYLVTEKFAGIDLHPEVVDNHEMGLAFEELIRKFAELSNETAGEHFTPREVKRQSGDPLHPRQHPVVQDRHDHRHQPEAWKGLHRAGGCMGWAGLLRQEREELHVPYRPS
jgi:type I restriction enzyme M protein